MDNTGKFYFPNPGSIPGASSNKAPVMKWAAIGDLSPPDFGRVGSNPTRGTT